MAISLAELRATPHDRERLMVYADWLQAQGHPRGELIAVSLLAETTRDAREYVWGRARAHELALASASLLPAAPGSAEGKPRSMWASWSRGFIRRLELAVTRWSPVCEGVRDGPEGWGELLAALLRHPSLALLEKLVIRVDEPADPAEQSAFALQMVLDGLEARRRDALGPPLQLDLWTSALPRSAERERLARELRVFRPYWFSWDLTMIPPPQGHAAARLLAGLAELRRNREQSVAFDMLWFDVRRQFLARLDARSGVIGGVQYDAQWSLHARRLAENAAPFAGELFARRVDAAFAPLRARFCRQAAMVAPPASLDPQVLSPALDGDAVMDELLERLSSLGVETQQLRGALHGFSSPMQWCWLERPFGTLPWRGFVGLGREDFLAFALLDAS